LKLISQKNRLKNIESGAKIGNFKLIP